MKDSTPLLILAIAVVVIAFGWGFINFSEPTSNGDPFVGDGVNSATLTMHASNDWNGIVDVQFYVNDIKVGIVKEVPIGMSGYKTYEYVFGSSYDSLDIVVKAEILVGGNVLKDQSYVVTIKNGGDYDFYIL